MEEAQSRESTVWTQVALGTTAAASAVGVGVLREDVLTGAARSRT